MKIGLIDVDGHHFPNLALMRISAYHKAHGDEVEWWWSDFIHYDIVYMSKIFSDAYSKDVPEPMNADKVIKGGTGYCISLGEDGKEHFDQSKNHSLPAEMEKMMGVRVLVINALRKEKHWSHYCLPEALEVIRKVRPERAYLTHISHEMGLHGEVEKELPEGVRLAYDNLEVEV